MNGSLTGRRVLVIGASSGIGRAVAEHALRNGARVVLGARRGDRLEEAAAAGDGLAVVCDVRDPMSCRAVVDAAVRELGAIDVLFYAAATVPLVLMADQTPEGWRDLFETNATGAFLVIAAALPQLAPGAVVGYTASSGVGSPYHGRGAYTASKAALDEGIRALRIEHPEVRFTRFLLGAVAGTEAGARDDPALAAQLMPEWVRRGRVLDGYLEPEGLGALLVDLLATLLGTGVKLDEISIDGPGQPIALPFEMADVVAAVSGFRAAPADG
jgi:NAD(P)-dependent dehydrogenase (short-subunit alcohol dehydrogenase family)